MQGAEPLLVAVTKGQPPEVVSRYYDAGLRDFGENRIQEALPKIKALPGDIKWHFIGHLQSNKVKHVVGRFVLIHSVDSEGLMRKIDKKAGELGIIQDILLEVNISGEETKYGFKQPELSPAAGNAQELSNISLRGLMTMAPYGASKKEAREIFSSLSVLGHGLGLKELSMGMSDDFEMAVAEGATILRIGRALFP